MHKTTTASNQGSDHKASSSNAKSGTNTNFSNSFNFLNSSAEEDVDGLQPNCKGSQDQLMSDLKEHVQVEIPCTSSPLCNSSTTVGNPFSKVGNVVVSDSDDEEVLDDHNVINYFGSGGTHRVFWSNEKRVHVSTTLTKMITLIIVVSIRLI